MNLEKETLHHTTGRLKSRPGGISFSRQAFAKRIQYRKCFRPGGMTGSSELVTLESAGQGVGAGVSAHWEFPGGSGGSWAQKAMGGKQWAVSTDRWARLEPSHTAPAGVERHRRAEPMWCARPGKGDLSQLPLRSRGQPLRI